MSLFQRPIAAVIVDLDGTMVDTLGDFHAALAATLGELQLPVIGRHDIERLVGKGSEHLIRSVLQEVGGDPALYPHAWEAYQRHYLAINGDHSQVYPGVQGGLDALRAADLPMACLTNKPGSFAVPLLQRKGLAPYFEVVFGGDAFEKKKPDPLPLRRTCEALGCDPGSTLVIGDSSNDAQAARAAGCPVILVTYGYNHGEPIRAVDADGFVDSLAEVAALLRA